MISKAPIMPNLKACDNAIFRNASHSKLRHDKHIWHIGTPVMLYISDVVISIILVQSGNRRTKLYVHPLRYDCYPSVSGLGGRRSPAVCFATRCFSFLQQQFISNRRHVETTVGSTDFSAISIKIWVHKVMRDIWIQHKCGAELSLILSIEYKFDI